MLTLAQALIKLEELKASGQVTTKQLMDLAAQVSLDTAPGYTQGSATLLYSGSINGVSSTARVTTACSAAQAMTASAATTATTTSMAATPTAACVCGTRAIRNISRRPMTPDGQWQFEHNYFYGLSRLKLQEKDRDF